MSRSFLGIPINNFKGNLTSFPSKLCGQSGLVAPVNIDWNQYNASSNSPSQTVIVDLAGNSQRNILNEIRSVYVDNTNSNVPIYVFFPDTGHTITCAPAAEGWFPVYTNGRIAWIIGEGFVTTLIPSTLLLFTNMFVQPFTNYELAQSADLWKASPAEQTGAGKVYNSNFASPALGDQILQLFGISLTSGVAIPINKFGPFAAPMFIYITQIYVLLRGLENNGVSANVSQQLSNDVDGVVYTASASGGNTAAGVINDAGQNICIADIRGNFKFNAQSNWQLQGNTLQNVIAGATDWTFAYTLSPV